MKNEIAPLIQESYSKKDVEEYLSYEATKSDQNTIFQRAKELLGYIPAFPNLCVPMNAALVVMIRDHTNIPIHMVAGTLDLHNQRVFGDYTEIVNWKEEFSKSNLDWAGHCWAVYGDYLVEASLFRTAYAPESPHWLRQMIIQEFGEGRGLMIGKIQDFRDRRLNYKAKYILTDEEITAALALVPLLRGGIKKGLQAATV